MDTNLNYPNPKTPAYIAILAAIIAFIIISIFTTSCGTVNKLKHKSDIKSDSTDLTKTVLSQTITEKIDTNITTKPDSIKQENSLSELSKGDTLKEENSGIIIETFEDTVKKIIHTKAVSKPKQIHVLQDKKIITNIKQNKDVEVKKETKESEKTVERSGLKWYWYLIIILLILLVIAYCIARKYWKFLP